MIKKIRSLWQSFYGDVDRRVRLGRILGLAFVTAGFIIVGVAWNGAAGQNIVEAQFPYVLSGGFMGVALVITGCTLIFLSTLRAERQLLTDKFDEMATLLSRNLGRLQVTTNGSGGSQEQVIATSAAYHRPDCSILKGKTGLSTISVDQAAAEGLQPCRACAPPRPAPTPSAEEVPSATTGTPDR
jgi:hypothetical protein